jgi:hypothetical protein
MKRRKFILASASLTAYGLLSKKALGELLAPQPESISEPYDDNKVVRVYDRRVSSHDFAGNTVYWKTIDVGVLRQMLAKSLTEISGEKVEAKAWRKILAGTEKADLSGKKIAIKVNFNNTIRDVHTTLNNSPAMMGVLAQSLLAAGMGQERICFFDCSRPFPEDFRKEVRQYHLDQISMLGAGDALPESGQTIFLSDNHGFPRDGKPTDQYPIPQCLMDADYLLNLHLVKIHMPGVTGAMKNLFGLAKNVAFHMHNGATKEFTVSNHLPDISLSPEIKKRARLNLAEFIFGGHSPDTIDPFTNEKFSPAGRPASLIVSRSPFYHDTVLYGFIKAEYETCVPVLKRFQTLGPDAWLKNSAARYPAWKYDQAAFVPNQARGWPPMDLAFSKVNYVSI